MDGEITEPDGILIAEASDLTPGRALEFGCGMGANAIWLAEQGWQVTAIDFSSAAIEKARQFAKERGADVGFVVADASTYQPGGEFDLVTSFYVQLAPDKRRMMLAMASDVLASGGTLLFIAHDEASPPHGWDEDDYKTLTTTDQVVAELPGLRIEKAAVFDHGEQGPHGMHVAKEEDEHGDGHAHGMSKSTVVRAVKAKA
jgi:SAM-dependent methyltransferase